MDAGRSLGAADPEAGTGLGSTAVAVGLVLAVFGGLLLAQQVYPSATWPQTAVAVVVDLISASIWAVSLYIGTILTLVTMPGLLGLGVGLLVVAARRALTGQGFGWQALVGALLVALGATCVMNPPVGGPFVPIVLLGVGAGLLSQRTWASERGESDGR